MPKSLHKTARTRKITRRLKRVFLLGAGVSAACGIPVARDILAHAVSALGKEDAEAQRRIHQLLEYLYPNFNVGLRNYPNIEDFLNLIEMAETFNSEKFIASARWPQEYVAKVKRDTLKAVTDFIWTCMRNQGDMSPVHKFVEKCVRDGDTIITFNWDLTVEHALEGRDDVDFWYGPAGDVLLLKPHGSVDWFAVNRLPGKDPRHKVQNLDKSLCVYPRFDFAAYRDLRATEPVIVPPISTKRFDWEFLRQTWRRVYIQISRATHLYVIGYSLPPEDQFARLVIGRSLLNNRLKVDRGEKPPLTVKVVNPDETVQTRFIRMIAGRTLFRFLQSSFESLVSAVDSGEVDFP